MKLQTIQRIALYLFCFSINYEVWGVSGYSISIARITGLIYLGTILPNFQQFFKVGILRSLLVPLWLFFGLLIAVNLVNVNFESFTSIEFSLFQNILLFWILLNHERKDSGILSKGMMAFALGSVSLAVLFYFNIGFEFEQGRVILFGDNPNNVGIRMSISFFIIATNYLNSSIKDSKFRHLLIITLIPIIMLLAVTGSRLAVIAFILEFIAVVLFFKTNKSNLRVLILLAGLSVGYYIWVYFMKTDVLQSRLLNTLYERDLGGREYIWAAVIKTIDSSPIWGIGTTGYNIYMRSVFGYVVPAHNVILEILAYTGIVGLSLYLHLFFKILRISYKNYQIHNDLLPLLLFIPFTGMLLSSHLLVVKIGWVVLAFMASKIFVLRQPAYFKK